MKYLEEANLLRQKSHLWLLGPGYMRRCGMDANGYGVSFWSNEIFLELDSGDCCTILPEY